MVHGKILQQKISQFVSLAFEDIEKSIIKREWEIPVENFGSD
jgi:hypothetical protein